MTDAEELRTRLAELRERQAELDAEVAEVQAELDQLFEERHRPPKRKRHLWALPGVAALASGAANALRHHPGKSSAAGALVAGGVITVALVSPAGDVDHSPYRALPPSQAPAQSESGQPPGRPSPTPTPAQGTDRPGPKPSASPQDSQRPGRGRFRGSPSAEQPPVKTPTKSNPKPSSKTEPEPKPSLKPEPDVPGQDLCALGLEADLSVAQANTCLIPVSVRLDLMP